MRKLLISSLVVFLLIDVFLAVTLLFPNLNSDIIQKITHHQITASSTVPSLKVSLVNKSYLNEKLEKLDFWGDKKVANYARAQLENVTVEKLKFVITDKPQLLAVRNDRQSKDPAQFNYSYGQLYEPSTKTMTLLLHLNRSVKTDRPLRDRYTGLALHALYDSTHPRTPDNESAYFKGLFSFMPEFVKEPGKNYIFNINSN